MDKTERALRSDIVAKCRWMNSVGLNQGTSGNISARHKDLLLITPTGIPYEELEPEHIATMPLGGGYGAWQGPLAPSSEWRFHLDITMKRPDVGAVVHTHSTYATTLSICRREIPACHYMIAAAGGSTVRCADYATFGTAELSDNALKALEGRNCCLLANHGMIVTGPDLGKTMWLAVELETLARQYYLSLVIGGPALLDDDEIERVKERFRGYGPQSRSSDEMSR